eukprot:75473-Pelagomonas_calceolata.AAC.1
MRHTSIQGEPVLLAVPWGKLTFVCAEDKEVSHFYHGITWLLHACCTFSGSLASKPPASTRVTFGGEPGARLNSSCSACMARLMPFLRSNLGRKGLHAKQGTCTMSKKKMYEHQWARQAAF